MLDKTWDLKKKLSNSVSNNRLDSLYNFAKKNGASGGKILGAGLDVLEYEKKSFEKLSISNNENLNYLVGSKNVIITPHIAGWTEESKIKLAEVAVKKIKKLINIK